ncbi:hypothetical protein K402DRAFT_389914 [Aulographum hederae CBS 113979]|uniref:F-box domain-containing protein n=1 Tax=Aulographum hederae CBS 113979 TaxID=1176131 RepID=A0A6G1HAN0_9PEZI|nr:hypothetical protein K402DRAFT_389914 [Aulographum hederae CBS 113979]
MDSSIASLTSLSSEEPASVFPFFDLPSELRLNILELILVQPDTVDLDPLNYRSIARPLLRLFLTSRRMHEEAYRVFYGSNTFRLFAVHGRFFHTKRPLFMRLPPKYKAAIRTLELRLGPGWTAPPKSWVANPRLGLMEAAALRVLNIFVECDPASDEIFKGFRVAGDFYTIFSRDLVKSIFAQVPTITEVHFDGYPSVAKQSPLIDALLDEAKIQGKKITWGSLKAWADGSAAELTKALASLEIDTETSSPTIDTGLSGNSNSLMQLVAVEA